MVVMSFQDAQKKKHNQRNQKMADKGNKGKEEEEERKRWWFCLDVRVALMKRRGKRGSLLSLQDGKLYTRKTSCEQTS